MKTKTPSIESYVAGNAPLPATFTTGYRRDLAIAREMIRLRGAGVPGSDASSESAVDPEDTEKAAKGALLPA